LTTYQPIPLTPFPYKGRGKINKRGAKPLSNQNLSPLQLKGSLKGLCPFKEYPSPSPLKERGIKGVR